MASLFLLLLVKITILNFIFQFIFIQFLIIEINLASEILASQALFYGKR